MTNHKKFEATDEMIDAACAAVSDLYRVDAMRAVEAAVSAYVPACSVDLKDEARRAIRAELPEDEPDCVPDWIVELLLTIGLQHGALAATGEQS